MQIAKKHDRKQIFFIFIDGMHQNIGLGIFSEEMNIYTKPSLHE